MTMGKSLLLGTAAGLVTIAGAQAADLPVKAKPVEYVKICSLYGVGFYYIPGTDMCIKIGGWVRAEYGWGNNGNFTWGWANGNVNNRTTNNSDFRARGYITADARNQTEYGTVRGYIAVGLSENEHGGDVAASNNFSANRAFIQWAGFTFGRAQSFFDFYSNPATSYWGSFPGSDTGDGGWFVMGYTAQFGNGFSGSIAAEAPRKTQIVDWQSVRVDRQMRFTGRWAFRRCAMAASRHLTSSATCASTRPGVQPRSWVPCIRSMPYYTTTVGASLPQRSPRRQVGFCRRCRHQAECADDRPGRLPAGAGQLHTGCSALHFPDPQLELGQGRWRKRRIRSAERRCGRAASLAAANASDLELTTAWNINAAYEHFWNASWRTSLYGGYAAVSYNDRGNAIACAFGGCAAADAGTTAIATPGCDNDWSTWWLGSRTQWNVTKDFYMGLDVMYSKLSSASLPADTTTFTTSIGGATHVSDADNWQFRFRVHRDFYP